MGQGAQSKALRIANQTQYGFDATKIYDAQGNVVGDIANFDMAPQLFKNQAGTGSLPEGTPTGWPDGLDVSIDAAPNAKDFEVGAGGGPDAQRRTTNANPNVGKESM